MKAAKGDDAFDVPGPVRLRANPILCLRPWTSSAVVRSVQIQLVSALLIGAAWYGASGTASFAAEMDWLKLGVGGLVLSGVANGLWLMSGRQAVGVAALQAFGNVVSKQSERDPYVAETFAVLGGTRYHRTGCQMLVGRSSRPARAELRPCELCRP